MEIDSRQDMDDRPHTSDGTFPLQWCYNKKLKYYLVLFSVYPFECIVTTHLFLFSFVEVEVEQ